MATFEKMAAKLTVALLLLSVAFTLDQAEARDGFEYTYKMRCTGPTWTKDDACNQPQCVKGGSHELESF